MRRTSNRNYCRSFDVPTDPKEISCLCMYVWVCECVCEVRVWSAVNTQRVIAHNFPRPEWMWLCVEYLDSRKRAKQVAAKNCIVLIAFSENVERIETTTAQYFPLRPPQTNNNNFRFVPTQQTTCSSPAEVCTGVRRRRDDDPVVAKFPFAKPKRAWKLRTQNQTDLHLALVCHVPGAARDWIYCIIYDFRMDSLQNCMRVYTFIYSMEAQEI